MGHWTDNNTQHQGLYVLDLFLICLACFKMGVFVSVLLGVWPSSCPASSVAECRWTNLCTACCLQIVRWTGVRRGNPTQNIIFAVRNWVYITSVLCSIPGVLQPDGTTSALREERYKVYGLADDVKPAVTSIEEFSINMCYIQCTVGGG